MVTRALPPTTSPFGDVDAGSKTRLLAQLKIQKKVERIREAPTINEKRRLLSEIAFYPKHSKRTETPEYKAVHKKLVVEKDLPCLVCGVKNSTLDDSGKNIYGAKQMETHHHVIEWALANAIDTAKFNEILRPNLAHRHPDNSEYQSPMTEQQVKDWVDHSSDNLWVLCDVHHRAKFFGIHEITYPIWCPMDLLRPDFEDYVRDHLIAAGQVGKRGSKGARTGGKGRTKSPKKASRKARARG